MQNVQEIEYLLRDVMSLYATQDEKKQAAAQAALKHLPKGGILGVGTGSTVNFLIELLPQ